MANERLTSELNYQRHSELNYQRHSELNYQRQGLSLVKDLKQYL
jgi:hypothetical protein